MYKITEEQKKVIEKGLLTAIDNGTDDEFTSQEMHLINDAFELVNNLTLCGVSQQRELLKSCFLALDEVSRDNAIITDEDAFIDEVIKDFNCG